MKEIHLPQYKNVRKISKLSAFIVTFGLSVLVASCEPESTKASPQKAPVETKQEKLEAEILKMLRKQEFNREYIFENTKAMSLEQKLTLVNQLAETHKIERMNKLKARVQMGTINSEQNSEVYRKEKEKNLQKIDGVLKDWAEEEGHIKK